MDNLPPDFWGYVSHKLKSPLVSIKSYVYIAKKKGDLTYVDEIDKKADYLNKNIDLIFKLLDLQGTNNSLTINYFNVSELFKKFPLRRISISVQTDKAIVGDMEMIREALLIILKKIKSEKGSIELTEDGISIPIKSKIIFPTFEDDPENWVLMEVAKRELAINKMKIKIGRENLVIKYPKGTKK